MSTANSEPSLVVQAIVAVAVGLSIALFGSFYTVGAVVAFAAIGFVVVVWRLARFLAPNV